MLEVEQEQDSDNYNRARRKTPAETHPLTREVVEVYLYVHAI